jgi:serine/threonine protein kinase/tetratricopeptide (TPR) repeat protein
MGGTPTTVHPDAAILALFAAGQLRDAQMAQLEEHLAECAVCLAAMEQIPEDPMVRVLRDFGSQIVGPSSETWETTPPGKDAGPVLEVEESARALSGDRDSAQSFRSDKDVAAGHLPRDLTEHPRYRVKSLLSRGGMGLVYLADDLVERRRVVLKFLREDLLDHPRLVERFRREVVAATRLKHPNIVSAYLSEEIGQSPALVMEFVQGMDLDEVIQRMGPLSILVASVLIRQAALGLQYSLEQGTVHRDIKPSNLMVTIDGKVKILDFGLAKLHSEIATDPGLTGTGALLGSVDYMSPEQADDPRLADIRADIYSLGCTFYYLLSGRPPFQGAPLDILMGHHSLEAASLNDLRPEVPAELAALVARMMAKDPAQRFQTPGEVAQALIPYLNAFDGTAASPGPALRRDEPAGNFTGKGEVNDGGPALVSPAVKAARRSSSRPWLALAAMGSVVAILLAGWLTYRIRGSETKSELVIETEVRNVAVRVTQGRKLVTLIEPWRKNRVELNPGEYEVGLFPDDPGLRLSRDSVTIKRGDTVVLAVRRRMQVSPDRSIAEYLKYIQGNDIPADASQAPQKAQSGPGNSGRFRVAYLKGEAVPRSADARYNLGVSLARHGWLERAAEALVAALEAQPDDPDVLFNLGVVLSSQGEEKLNEAIAHFRAAIGLQPAAADAHIALGLALADQGELDEAVSEMRKAVALKPDDADGWYNLGVVLKDHGQASAAIDAFGELIRLEPDLADAHDMLGALLADLGRTSDAAAARREATRLHGVAVSKNNLGIELAQEQKLGEAIAAFRNAVRIQPGLAEAHINLGTALLDQEKMAAAMDAFRTAIRLEPGIAAAHLNLAIALRRLGASKAAEAAYFEATRLQRGIDFSRKCWVRAPVEERGAPPRRVPPLRRPRIHESESPK